jgi:hypothetical protein
MVNKVVYSHAPSCVNLNCLKGEFTHRRRVGLRTHLSELSKDLVEWFLGDFGHCSPHTAITSLLCWSEPTVYQSGAFCPYKCSHMFLWLRPDAVASAAGRSSVSRSFIDGLEGNDWPDPNPLWSILSSTFTPDLPDLQFLSSFLIILGFRQQKLHPNDE